MPVWLQICSEVYDSEVTKTKLVTLISWSQHSFICQNVTIAGLQYKTESHGSDALNRSGLYMSYECNW